MKPHTFLKILGVIGIAAVLTSSLEASPFGSAFTYQGRLNFSGAPAVDGFYDFNFTLHDAATLGAPVGAAVTVNAVPVSNGVFTAHLDFGAPAFTSGEARWLQLQVNTNGVTPLAALNPRQRLTPTPQAIYAGTAGTANAVAPGAITSAGLAVDAVDGGVIFDGSVGPADLAPSLLNKTFWKLGGNSGPDNFLGSTDNQPVELRVNNQSALRLLPNATSPNVVGGHSSNFVNFGRSGAFIGGGGTATDFNVANGNYAAVVGGRMNRAFGDGAFIGGGLSNRVEQVAGFVGGGFLNSAGRDFATVAGGFFNTVVETNGTIGGGSGNIVSGNQAGSTIAGGMNNYVLQIQAGVIAGGLQNHITGNSATAAIGGGYQNFIETNGNNGTIGGGFFNLLTAPYATVGGGRFNSAHAERSTISGGDNNNIEARSFYATIGGGANNHIGTDSGSSTIAGGVGNVTSAPYTVIGGGENNFIESNAWHATIGGGGANGIVQSSVDATIAGGVFNYITNSLYVAIGGGFNNIIESGSHSATIAGGRLNAIGTNSLHGAISGGASNLIAANSSYGTIAGGSQNRVIAQHATVPGGTRNLAAGDYSFAAGRRAKANHDGSFVWADDTDADFASTTNKQFAVRANNGVMIQASATALDIRGGGALRVEGAGVNSVTPIFTHRATASNITGPETRIDHPHCNGKPNAILILTYNFNPAGVAGVRNDRPFGLYYTGTRWAIYNLDGTAMPVGAAYNVLVANP